MIHTIFIRLACAAIVLASIFKPLLADAAELPQPTGKIVLTVTGKIGNTNQDGAAVLDLDMLKKFGDDEITTNTIWTQGERHFTGVFMNKLLEALDVQGDMVVVQAINDYRAEDSDRRRNDRFGIDRLCHGRQTAWSARQGPVVVGLSLRR